MIKPQLTYFDFSGSRGEECRLALHAAGVDFEDDRLPGDRWPPRKASTPFGSLPVLSIEGKGQLAESNAILCFIGRAHGLHPQDLWTAAQHEAIMSAAESVRHALSATSGLKAEDDKKAAREALASGQLAQFGKGIEAQLGEGPFVGGDELNVVDIKLYIVLRGFVTGVYDHLPKTIFAGYPRLMRLYHAVEQHPKIVEWMSR